MEIGQEYWPPLLSIQNCFVRVEWSENCLVMLQLRLWPPHSSHNPSATWDLESTHSVHHNWSCSETARCSIPCTSRSTLSGSSASPQDSWSRNRPGSFAEVAVTALGSDRRPVQPGPESKSHSKDSCWTFLAMVFWHIYSAIVWLVEYPMANLIASQLINSTQFKWHDFAASWASSSTTACSNLIASSGSKVLEASSGCFSPADLVPVEYSDSWRIDPDSDFAKQQHYLGPPRASELMRYGSASFAVVVGTAAIRCSASSASARPCLNSKFAANSFTVVDPAQFAVATSHPTRWVPACSQATKWPPPDRSGCWDSQQSWPTYGSEAATRPDCRPDQLRTGHFSLWTNFSKVGRKWIVFFALAESDS